MVNFIQSYLDEVVDQVKDWIKQVDERQLLMNKDKNAIFLQQDRFEKKMTATHQEWVDTTQKNLEAKGFEIQNVLHDRMHTIEDKIIVNFKTELVEN